jgi:hypothetical protein
MEVARLVNKNERLLPMTRDLEELTTELRGVVVSTGETEAPDRTFRVLENIRGRVAELAAAIAERSDDPSRNVQVVSDELTPAARQVAAALQQVSRGIGGQVQRLDQLLQLAATLTGIDVPSTATADPVVEPGNSLFVDRFDPFHAGRPGDAPGIDADPFANSRSVFNPDEQDSDFCQSTLPGINDNAAGSFAMPVSSVADLQLVTRSFENAAPSPAAHEVPDLGDVFAAVTPPPEPAPTQCEVGEAVGETALEERVYELSEFDGVLVGVGEAEDVDHIHDLTEFNAERVA